MKKQLLIFLLVLGLGLLLTGCGEGSKTDQKRILKALEKEGILTLDSYDPVEKNTYSLAPVPGTYNVYTYVDGDDIDNRYNVRFQKISAQEYSVIIGHTLCDEEGNYYVDEDFEYSDEYIHLQKENWIVYSLFTIIEDE